jgi:hypothetical protein
MQDSDTRAHLQEVIEMLKATLTAEDYQAARQYLEAGELHVTFEHLCEQLYAYNAGISLGVYKSLEAIGEMLNYEDHSHWQDLAPQVNR